MARSLTSVVARASNFDLPTCVDATTALRAPSGRVTPLLARLDSRPVGLLNAAVLDALLASDRARERDGLRARVVAHSTSYGTVWAVVLSDWLFDSSLEERTAELNEMVEAWRDNNLFDLKRRASTLERLCLSP